MLLLMSIPGLIKTPQPKKRVQSVPRQIKCSDFTSFKRWHFLRAHFQDFPQTQKKKRITISPTLQAVSWSNTDHKSQHCLWQFMALQFTHCFRKLALGIIYRPLFSGYSWRNQDTDSANGWPAHYLPWCSCTWFPVHQLSARHSWHPFPTCATALGAAQKLGNGTRASAAVLPKPFSTRTNFLKWQSIETH